MNIQFVWPESLHRPLMEEKVGTNNLHQPMIFCAIPHGAAPMGITAYPIWSKLFNNRLCHWTCAPVVLKLPIIKDYMRQIGYIPAKSTHILDALTKKEDNIGIILDGIAGMFQSQNEIAHVNARKGIVKIALRAGAPLIPVYGFGHTSLWKVVVDPFGILEKLSVKMDVSLTPFVSFMMMRMLAWRWLEAYSISLEIHSSYLRFISLVDLVGSWALRNGWRSACVSANQSDAPKLPILLKRILISIIDNC